MEKDWSVDETINQIKHLLLEKDAEIERLREEIFNLRTEVHFDDQTIKSLQVINERLREALKRIGNGDTCMGLMTHPPICKRAYDARAALKDRE